MTATDPALTALAQGWSALALLHGGSRPTSSARSKRGTT